MPLAASPCPLIRLKVSSEKFNNNGVRHKVPVTEINLSNMQERIVSQRSRFINIIIIIISILIKLKIHNNQNIYIHLHKTFHKIVLGLVIRNSLPKRVPKYHNLFPNIQRKISHIFQTTLMHRSFLSELRTQLQPTNSESKAQMPPTNSESRVQFPSTNTYRTFILISTKIYIMINSI